MTNAEAFMKDLQALIEKYQVTLQVGPYVDLQICRKGVTEIVLPAGILKPGDPLAFSGNEPTDDGPVMPPGYRFAESVAEMDLDVKDPAWADTLSFLANTRGPVRIYIYPGVVVAFAQQPVAKLWYGVVAQR